MLFLSISPGVFFRPEENTILSKGIDDVGILQTAEIHVGDKNNGTAIRFLVAAIQVTVDLQLHGTLAMGAFRLNLYDYLCFP